MYMEDFYNGERNKTFYFLAACRRFYDCSI